MTQIKIYVIHNYSNGTYCWESHPNISGLSGGPFDDRLLAIKNLEATVLASNTVDDLEVVDSAGVRIPRMFFSRSFADKYDIGDDHPSYRK